LRIIRRRSYLLVLALGLTASALGAPPASAAAANSFDSIRRAAGGTACSLPATPVTRAAYIGNTGYPANGTVVANRHFRVTGSGFFAVYGDNVTFRNVCIDSNVDGAIRLQPRHRALHVIDSTIRGGNVAGGAGVCGTGLGLGAGSTAVRVVSTGCEDGFLIGSGSSLVDSWCHGLVGRAGGHNDCIQITGGTNMTIRHNVLDGPWRGQTSAILVKSDFQPINNVTIESNYISGGAYTIYVRSGGYPTPTNVRLVNNSLRAGSAMYGPCSYDAHRPLSVNTRWYDNRRPAPC
jgi:hypothetical protein